MDIIGITLFLSAIGYFFFIIALSIDQIQNLKEEDRNIIRLIILIATIILFISSLFQLINYTQFETTHHKLRYEDLGEFRIP